MPQVKKVVTLAANGTAEVPLGRYNRIAGRGAVVQVWAAIITAAAAVGDVDLNFALAADQIVDKGAVSVNAAGVRQDQDQIGQGVGAPSDTIIVELVNRIAAVRDVDVQINIQLI